MASELQPLGVGVIGLGVGLAHVATFNSVPGVEVRSVCDLDIDLCMKAKSLVPDARVVSEWRHVVTSTDVDIVVVATPDALHAEMIKYALSHSKHVFAEKPICLSAGELSLVVQALRDNPNSHFSANMVLRANPIFIQLRSDLAAGSMGLVSHMEMSYLYGRFNKILLGWRGQPPRYSAFLGGGIHMVDLALWLVGERPVSVIGVGQSIASEGLGRQIDDLEIAILKFQNGLTATISAVMASSVPHSHVVTIHGTKKSFMMGPLGCGYLNSDPTSASQDVAVPLGYDRRSIATSFVDEIIGRRPALVPAADVLDCTAVALAVRESIATGVETPVKYP